MESIHCSRQCRMRNQRFVMSGWVPSTLFNFIAADEDSRENEFNL